MKRILKWIICDLALFIPFIGLTGCGSDNKKSEEELEEAALLIGTWAEDNSGDDYYESITFKSDGSVSGVLIEEDGKGDGEDEIIKVSGTYKLSYIDEVWTVVWISFKNKEGRTITEKWIIEEITSKYMEVEDQIRYENNTEYGDDAEEIRTFQKK